ncbi:MAG: DUF1501 domain-containing protein [Armatimonadetes bacterium]|nr:DUF1501 domain-containing protein [Armatimonadota bacterium]
MKNEHELNVNPDRVIENECAESRMMGDWAPEITRREFVKAGFTLVAVGLVAPPWLATLAHAETSRTLNGLAPANDRILVVLQLTGGNDGLNTVIPYSNSSYYRLRQNLAIRENTVIKLDDRVGLHPALTGLKDLFDQKKVAILQGVGYPNPNRSHFRSMEIWQTADPDGYQKYGWLGKYLDTLGDAATNPVLSVSLTQEKPQALNAGIASVPCFASLGDLQALTGDAALAETMMALTHSANKGDNPANLIKRSTRSALEAIEKLRVAMRNYQSDVTYGADPFGRGLQQAAQLIAASPATKVIYVSVNGFDTHAAQARTHENLLRNFGNALKTFEEDLAKMNKSDKVMTLVFSEFGRRAAENGSAGTDHGAAGPMFLMGGKVKGGFYGDHPSLDSLDRGDLKYQIDFRSVYATALEWLGADAEKLIGKAFKPVNVFG